MSGLTIEGAHRTPTPRIHVCAWMAALALSQGRGDLARLYVEEMEAMLMSGGGK